MSYWLAPRNLELQWLLQVNGVRGCWFAGTFLIVRRRLVWHSLCFSSGLSWHEFCEVWRISDCCSWERAAGPITFDTTHYFPKQVYGATINASRKYHLAELRSRVRSGTQISHHISEVQIWQCSTRIQSGLHTRLLRFQNCKRISLNNKYAFSSKINPLCPLSMRICMMRR